MNSARLHATDSSSFRLIYREYLLEQTVILIFYLGHPPSRRRSFNELSSRKISRERRTSRPSKRITEIPCTDRRLSSCLQQVVSRKRRPTADFDFPSVSRKLRKPSGFVQSFSGKIVPPSRFHFYHGSTEAPGLWYAFNK